MEKENIDTQTDEGFGDDWERFDQSQLNPEEARLFRIIFCRITLARFTRTCRGF
ncbi:MAG: hypothetical protein ACI9J2_000888 [Saprospiraceae bacterium]|jgi:hypothetical protein